MLKLIIQKNKKGEPTGKLILESFNAKSKAPYNFKYAAPNAIVLMPNQLVDLIQSVKTQQIEINKVCRAYANGAVLKVEVTEFGVKVKSAAEIKAEEDAKKAKELSGGGQ